MDTSVKYEPKVDQAVDYTPLHSREQPEEREFTPNYVNYHCQFHCTVY